MPALLGGVKRRQRHREEQTKEKVEINSKDDPIGYLRNLVERDRSFKAGLEKRDSEEGIDYTSFSWDQLDGSKTKTPGAAKEEHGETEPEDATK